MLIFPALCHLSGTEMRHCWTQALLSVRVWVSSGANQTYDRQIRCLVVVVSATHDQSWVGYDKRIGGRMEECRPNLIWTKTKVEGLLSCRIRRLGRIQRVRPSVKTPLHLVRSRARAVIVHHFVVDCSHIRWGVLQCAAHWRDTGTVVR